MKQIQCITGSNTNLSVNKDSLREVQGPMNDYKKELYDEKQSHYQKSFNVDDSDYMKSPQFNPSSTQKNQPPIPII